MIHPVNINIENHTVDLICDKHNGSVVALDLNTKAAYVDDGKLIQVKGEELSPSCSCAVYFPVTNGNQDAQDIAAAKIA